MLIALPDRLRCLNASNFMSTYLIPHSLFFQDVEGMMSISVEAAAARESLSDDKEIVNTYEVE